MILIEVIIIGRFIQFYLEVIIVRALFILFDVITIRGILLFDVAVNDVEILQEQSRILKNIEKLFLKLDKKKSTTSYTAWLYLQTLQ